MFFAACEGYSDKVEEQNLVYRKIANAAAAGWLKSAGDFDKFWPLPGRKAESKKFVWGSKEEANEMRERIQKAHGIKLK